VSGGKSNMVGLFALMVGAFNQGRLEGMTGLFWRECQPSHGGGEAGIHLASVLEGAEWAGFVCVKSISR